ncbi:MAG: DUF2284 domain-containing protein [Ruminiclostridium sp.]|nr:DUF2284 domain-containing protein [Ruminiclostridium sp.]
MGTSISCVASTASGRYEYAVEIVAVNPLLVSDCCDKNKFDSLCKCGCPNFQRKWSCPPYAPEFSDFVSKWEHLYVIFMHTDMAQFFYIKNNYLKIKAANSLLKSRADKFLRRMAKRYGHYISTGSCRLCKPCKCKTEMPCAHPELMTYSFEAMGVDVGKLVDAYFQKSLLWYKSRQLPEYTAVVCGLLTNEKLSLECIMDEYRMCITD